MPVASANFKQTKSAKSTTSLKFVPTTDYHPLSKQLEKSPFESSMPEYNKRTAKDLKTFFAEIS
jgi:hypothetical protein